MNLLLATYAVARQLPQTERFELSAQMRRAAVSVPSNIAEGQATGPGGRYRHHVRIALGSLAELDTELEAVRRLEYSSEEALRVVAEHLAQTGRLLHGLDRSLAAQALCNQLPDTLWVVLRLWHAPAFVSGSELRSPDAGC